MPDNRRKYMRISSQQIDCKVRLGVGESAGFVVDESIDGLRVGGLDLLLLAADQRIEVEYLGQTLIGRCRSVARDENGLFQVGIYREDPSYRANIRSMLLNSFMTFNGCDIVCLPISVVNEEKIRVRLMDGNEFTVQKDQVFQISRDEREMELQSQHKLSELLQVYSLMDANNRLYSLNDILDYEFGPAVGVMTATK